MIRRLMLAASGIAFLTMAGSSTVQGQNQNTGQQRPNDAAATQGGAAAQNRNFWNEPSFRLRALRTQVSERRPTAPGGGGPGGGGGRGGRGGGGFPGFGGGGGNAMVDLLMQSPALQEELKLSEEQKRGLDEIRRGSRDKQREMFRTMMANRQQNAGAAQGGQQRRGGGRFDPAQMQAMGQAMSALQQESAMALGKVLTPAQMKRLEEIRLRIIGPTAVAEEKIARSLMMAEQQYMDVQNIMQQYDTQSGELMRGAFQAMRPPGGGGPGGRGGAPAAGGNPNANRPNTPEDAAARRREFQNSPQFQEMQNQMSKMTDAQDELLKEAEKALGKVLTSRQKANFNKMLGEDFDLTKLVENTGRGGRGGRGQGGPPGAGPDDEEGVGAAPATPKSVTPAPAGEEEEEAAPAPGRRVPPPRVRGSKSDTGSGG